jgi:microcystin-dependent protein
MKSRRLTHHPGYDATKVSTVEDEIENTKTNVASLQNANASLVGSLAWFALNRVPANFLKCDGSAVSRTTYATLFGLLIYSATVTITIASPAVITWTAHGLSLYDPVKFTTTGALPTGITASTTYYVSTVVDANNIQISATPGGSAINTSGSQSGVHTGINAPWGDGDGSTTFNVPDLRGEFVRGWDAGRGADATRSFGSSQAHAFFRHNHAITDPGHVHSYSRAINAGINAAPTGSYVAFYTYDTPNTGSSTTGITVNNTSSNDSTVETRPRNFPLMACIRYQ